MPRLSREQQAKKIEFLNDIKEFFKEDNNRIFEFARNEFTVDDLKERFKYDGKAVIIKKTIAQEIIKKDYPEDVFKEYVHLSLGSGISQANKRPEVKERHSKASKEAANRPEVKAKQKAAREKLVNDPNSDYRKHLSEGIKAAYQRPEVKAKRKEIQDSEEYRAKLSKGIKGHYEKDGAREKASGINKRSHNTIEYKTKASQIAKDLFNNNDFKKRFNERMNSKEVRERISEGVKKSYDDELRKRKSDIMTEVWSNKTDEERRLIGQKIHETMSTPEYKKKASLIYGSESTIKKINEAKKGIKNIDKYEDYVNQVRLAYESVKGEGTSKEFMKNEKFLDQMSFSKNSSRGELFTYGLLIANFGVNDIERQYYSDKYPYACDFYIHSLDTYIECQYSWTHGDHPYNKDNHDDEVRLEYMQNKTSKYYNITIQVWTNSDPKKRQNAEKNNLNFVELWNVDDASEFIDVHKKEFDQNEENMRTVFNHTIDLDKQMKSFRNVSHAYSKTSLTANSIIKYYQFSELYKNELSWLQNASLIELKDFYDNRMKYIGKDQNSMTSNEKLRGLNITKKVQSYSMFQTNAMLAFIDEFNIKSVIDPTMGWGHRLLAASISDIDYIGNDINEKTYKNNEKLLNDLTELGYFKNHEVKLMNEDAKDLHVEADALFTCPPYFDREHYTDAGAENLDYEQFLDWWKQVITNQDVRYIAYVINARYRDDMNKIIEDSGYEFIREERLSTRKSHLNKHKDEYEGLQIFKKC